MPTSDFLHEATERGFVFQCTDTEGLDAALRAGIIAGYIGFDCTADSLHVGSLVQIMLLRLMQRCGHRPVVLMGGGTTRIGDPSGKDESRQLLSDEQIQANKQGILRCFKPFVRFGDGPTDAPLVDNAEWLDALGYIPLLREVGVHFTINRMLAFDSVRLRLEREQPMTFLEFNYMILQSYDFRELFRRQGVLLQMGGSDQWGNIVSGVDLVRRTDGKQVFGLTTPLITTASGAKMGKTAKGAIWLTSDKLSAHEYWQFWRDVEDADVGRFLRLFTDLPLAEIARLEKLQGQELNEAKKILATEATRLAHGEDAETEAPPTVDISRADFEAGVPAFRLFVIAGLAASNGEARRLIRGGGARLNDQPIADEALTLTLADLPAEGALKLSAGRKQHRMLRAV
ncbi:MAG: tyrosine--tRNA ligase [Proteobacteria bacterium]|nr:tyrosine--tRNA ligase [Pseudomonadota bacterium]